MLWYEIVIFICFYISNQPVNDVLLYTGVDFATHSSHRDTEAPKHPNISPDLNPNAGYAGSVNVA